MTLEEYKSHFSLWAVLAAPLMAGNDLAGMSADTKAILTNREVIAVDQDPLGIQASRVAKQGEDEVWARPLKGGGRAVVLLNRSATTHRITVTWGDLRLPAALRLKVRDLWAHRNLRDAQGHFSADVPSHGVVMLRME
jgi:alpha-galactosidase